MVLFGLQDVAEKKCKELSAELSTVKAQVAELHPQVQDLQRKLQFRSEALAAAEAARDRECKGRETEMAELRAAQAEAIKDKERQMSYLEAQHETREEVLISKLSSKDAQLASAKAEITIFEVCTYCAFWFPQCVPQW